MMRAGTAIGRPAGIEAERDFIAHRISRYAWFKGEKKRFKSILNTLPFGLPHYTNSQIHTNVTLSFTYITK